VETLHSVEIPHVYRMFYFHSMQSFHDLRHFHDLRPGRVGPSLAAPSKSGVSPVHGARAPVIGVATACFPAHQDAFVEIFSMLVGQTPGGMPALAHRTRTMWQPAAAGTRGAAHNSNKK